MGSGSVLAATLNVTVAVSVDLSEYVTVTVAVTVLPACASVGVNDTVPSAATVNPSPATANVVPAGAPTAAPPFVNDTAAVAFSPTFAATEAGYAAAYCSDRPGSGEGSSASV